MTAVLPQKPMLVRSCVCALVAATLSVSGALSGHAQTSSNLYISADGPRPLAECLDRVERTFGWIVTYEDPPYQHASETDDVTSSVRRDGKTHPRVVVPRGGAFGFSYALPSSGAAPEPAALLEALLARYEASGNPGYFRALTEGAAFHVVPTRFVNDAGVIVEYISLLESMISLEPGERTVLEVVRSIVAAVGTETGARIVVGAAPLNILQLRVRVDSSTQRARTLLDRYLASTQRQISWRLFYDPGMKLHVLNLHGVPNTAGGR